MQAGFIENLQLPKLTIDISTEGFLHKTDLILIDCDAFRDQFGRDELILVAIQSPEVFEEDFLHRLKELHDDLAENVHYIEDITSLINARNTLTLLASTFGIKADDGSFQRLDAEYDVTDAISIRGGVVFYQSGDKGTFKNIGDNDRLFLEFRYSF
jgi:hypothetical protein